MALKNSYGKKWFEMAQPCANGWKWLEMTENCQNSWNWINIAGLA